MTSLHGFCKDRNLAKSTAHAWLQAQGFDTSNGLSPEAQQALIDQFFEGSDPLAVVASAPVEPPIYHPIAHPMRAGGLVPLVSGGITRPVAVFDSEQYQADKAQLGVTATATAADINSMVTAYAQNRIAGVLADIDLTADSIRANAMQAMGVEPGKPSAA